MVGFLEKNLVEQIEYLKGGREAKFKAIERLKQDQKNYETELVKIDEAIAEFTSALEQYKKNGGTFDDKQGKGTESEIGRMVKPDGRTKETSNLHERGGRKESTK